MTTEKRPIKKTVLITNDIEEIHSETDKDKDKDITEVHTELNNEKQPNLKDLVTKIIRVSDREDIIRWIIHLADIHIRKNDSRDDEYIYVIDQLCIELKKHRDKLAKAVIVVCGDIIHDGGDYKPNSIDLFNYFFNQLLQYADVILIYGNHDGKKVASDKLVDGIKPLIKGIRSKHNLYYLQETGYYDYGNNIRFTVNSVFDGKAISNDPKTDRLKISLYHGIVRGSKSQNNQYFHEDFCSKIDLIGCDFGFLGDIHLPQIITNNNTSIIAYPGSLIQQNHGESIHDHGMILWDLEERIGEFIRIKNKYCYLTISLDKVNGITVHDLSDEFLKTIPKLIRLRIKYQNLLPNECSEHLDKLAEQYGYKYLVKSWSLQSVTLNVNENVNGNVNITKIENNKQVSNVMNNILEWYIQKQLVEKYCSDEKLDSNNTADMLKLHYEIFNETIITYEPDSRSKDWYISSLAFSNLLCYGDNNYVEFDKFGYGKCVGINGPNASGKSSILDILCFGLFGEPIRLTNITDLVNDTTINKAGAIINSYEIIIDYFVDGVRHRLMKKMMKGSGNKGYARLGVLRKKDGITNTIKWLPSDLMKSHPFQPNDDEHFVEIDSLKPQMLTDYKQKLEKEAITEADKALKKKSDDTKKYVDEDKIQEEYDYDIKRRFNNKIIALKQKNKTTTTTTTTTLKKEKKIKKIYEDTIKALKIEKKENSKKRSLLEIKQSKIEGELKIIGYEVEELEKKEKDVTKKLKLKKESKNLDKNKSELDDIKSKLTETRRKYQKIYDELKINDEFNIIKNNILQIDERCQQINYLLGQKNIKGWEPSEELKSTKINIDSQKTTDNNNNEVNDATNDDKNDNKNDNMGDDTVDVKNKNDNIVEDDVENKSESLNSELLSNQDILTYIQNYAELKESNISTAIYNIITQQIGIKDDLLMTNFITQSTQEGKNYGLLAKTEPERIKTFIRLTELRIFPELEVMANIERKRIEKSLTVKEGVYNATLKDNINYSSKVDELTTQIEKKLLELDQLKQKLQAIENCPPPRLQEYPSHLNVDSIPKLENNIIKLKEKVTNLLHHNKQIEDKNSLCISSKDKSIIILSGWMAGIKLDINDILEKKVQLSERLVNRKSNIKVLRAGITKSNNLDKNIKKTELEIQEYNNTIISITTREESLTNEIQIMISSKQESEKNKEIDDNYNNYLNQISYIKELDTQIKNQRSITSKNDVVVQKFKECPYNPDCHACRTNPFTIEAREMVALNERYHRELIELEEKRKNIIEPDIIHLKAYEDKENIIKKNKQIDESLNKLNSKLNENIKRKLSVSEKKLKLEKELHIMNIEQNKHHENNRINEQIDVLNEECKQISEDLKKYEIFEEIINNRNEIENVESEIFKTNKYINNILLEEKHKEFRKNLSKMNEGIIQYSNEVETLKNELKTYREKYEKQIQAKQEYEKVFNELNKYKNYIKMVGKSGIPHNLTKAWIERLETVANNFLDQTNSAITDTNSHIAIKIIIEKGDAQYNDENDKITAKLKQKLKRKEKESDVQHLKIVRIKKNGKNILSKASSGSEQFRIDLAIKLALITCTNTGSCRFLIIDESFHNFDQQTLANIDVFLEPIKANFSQLFLISHLASLQDNYDYTISIKKDPNGNSIIDTRPMKLLTE